MDPYLELASLVLLRTALAEFEADEEVEDLVVELEELEEPESVGVADEVRFDADVVLEEEVVSEEEVVLEGAGFWKGGDEEPEPDRVELDSALVEPNEDPDGDGFNALAVDDADEPLALPVAVADSVAEAEAAEALLKLPVDPSLEILMLS